MWYLWIYIVRKIVLDFIIYYSTAKGCNNIKSDLFELCPFTFTSWSFIPQFNFFETAIYQVLIFSLHLWFCCYTFLMRDIIGTCYIALLMAKFINSIVFRESCVVNMLSPLKKYLYKKLFFPSVINWRNIWGIWSQLPFFCASNYVRHFERHMTHDVVPRHGFKTRHTWLHTSHVAHVSLS